MQVLPHIETSQLICYANPLTAFYMRATLEFNGLKKQMQYSRHIYICKIHMQMQDRFFQKFFHKFFQRLEVI